MKSPSTVIVTLFVSLLLTTINCGLLNAQNKSIDSLKALLNSDKQDTNKVNHLNKICWEYINIVRYDSAIYYGILSNKLSETINYKKGLARSCNTIGTIYWYKNNYLQALDYWSEALIIYKELNDKSKILTLQGTIGSAYTALAQYPKAIESYFNALKMSEELKDEQNIATNLCNLGAVYYLQKENLSKAIDYNLKGLLMAKRVGDKQLQASVIGNIGTVYYEQKNYPQALHYFSEALRMSKELKNLRLEMTITSNVGNILIEQKNYVQAKIYYSKALKIAEELGDNSNVAMNLANIGNLYYKTGNFNDSEDLLKKAIALADSSGELNNLMQFEESLSQLYDTMEQDKLALIHYKKSIALKDTIFNQENRKELVQKEMNYEFYKKETAIKAENEKQRAIEEERTRRQTLISWSIGGGLFLVLIFAGFILRSLRITNKQKNLIEQQKNEVSKQKDIADSQRILAEELRHIAEKQKHLVEEKQKEIVDSITYAKRIQTALLTSDNYIQTNFEAEHFILFKPKDIVSGDFYWALSHAYVPGWDLGISKVKLPPDEKRKNLFYLATADCTGHGVPGAFMSMLNISYLNENIIERGILLPHEVLNSQRDEIIKALNPAGSKIESKDGMDCVLCVYDFNKMLLHFAAANNPLWLVRNNELTEYKADKMPVGKYGETNNSFTLQTIELQKGDTIYTSTDGYADQFGANDKKLMKKRFKEELLKIHQLPMPAQKQYLDQFFENWKGTTEQVDDVCVIGVRI